MLFRSTAPDGYVLWSVTVITTQAQEHLMDIHDRMPLLVPPALRAAWLAPGQATVAQVLAAAPKAADIEAWPVSADVGNVRNNRPDLIERAAGE